MYRHCLSTVTLLAVAAAIFGCAESQPNIDRIEAYAMPKTMFRGEWFYHKTVVDTPSSSSISFIGATSWGSQFRIRWDVQEHYLYARSAHEFIDGARQTDANPYTGEFKGEILGAWKVSSHFDLKKGYNPSTGEATNTLMENSQDCVWYDCKYMRVDWSTNHATDPNFLHWGWSGLIKKDPMPFFVQDETDSKYKPVFDEEAGYIDVTTALAVHPQSIYFKYWDLTVPTCWLSAGRNKSCTSEIVKVRHSLWRRPPNHDYEARLHRGEQDEWFGYFVNQRWKYFTNQGMTFRTKKHYMLRHNIWTKHHDETASCTKDSECKTAGSFCDVEVAFHKNDVTTDTDADGLPDAFEKTVTELDPNNADSDGDTLVDGKDDSDGNGKRDIEDFWAWDGKNVEYRCTIPFKDRDPKPIVYYASGDWPKSLTCDEHFDDITKDKDPAPCKPYKFSADKKLRSHGWSSMHYSSVNYEDAFWKVYLRGGYGWNEADYQKWIASRDPSKMSAAQQAQLKKFGDKTHGFYSFSICPNNPVEETDAWPCRFPRHSFAQAKELMDAGLKFNHDSYDLAKKRLADNKTINNAKPLVRVGDMRYSVVHWVKEYSPTGPLGYGPNASDSRTGEIVSGMANIYVACDYIATRIDNLIKVLNGEMTSQQFIDGVDIQNWIKKTNSEMTASTKSAGQNTTGFHSHVVSQADLEQTYKSMSQPWLQKIPSQGSAKNFGQMKGADGNPLNSTQLKVKLMSSLEKSGLFAKNKAVDVDLTSIKGSQLERRLIDNDILMAAGYGPGEVKTITDDVLNRASIARPGGVISFIEAKEEWKDSMRRHNIIFADDYMAAVDGGLTGLAARLKHLNLTGAKRWAAIRNILVRPLIVHEMGHSLGLMHNFGGSEDALNYHQEYWKLRTNDGADTKACTATPAAGQLCPFYLRAMNNYQLGSDKKNLDNGLLGINEYAYTSVMDYDRWSTMQGLGLGRYDVAAFMYGYTDKVEVFKDTGNVPTTPHNIFDLWHEGKGDVLILDKAAPKSFHYTNWYTLMGDKAINESNRELVDYREVKKVRDAAGKSQGWFHTSGSAKRPRVPYIYCTHGWSNKSGRCMTWDWGADYYERMKMHVDNWDTWYIQNAFPRGRFYWSAGRYVGRRYNYFYKRLKDFNNTYALYQGLFHQWYDNAAITKFFTDPVNGWGDYTMAMHDGFNVAMQTLAMPDITNFQDKAVQGDGQTIYTESAFSSKFATDVSNARYFATSYYYNGSDCGIYWWECLHHIGFYMDKVMAMFALSNARTYFVGQDAATDIRTYRINFFDNFGTQIGDFFSAMLGEDHEAISPWYDPDKKVDAVETDSKGIKWVSQVARRNYADPTKDPAKPANGAAIESSTRFTLQLYGAVMGMFLFQQNFDNSYVERSRMWKEGKGTTWTITPTAKIDGVAKYTSPYNGVTYGGIAYKNGKGIAQKVIRRANALKARTSYCTPAQTPPVDPAPVDLCVSVSTALAATAEFDLKKYGDLLEVIVQVTTMYDQRSGNWSGSVFWP